MIKQFILPDGSYIDVSPENLSDFLQRNPDAVEVTRGVRTIGRSIGGGAVGLDTVRTINPRTAGRGVTTQQTIGRPWRTAQTPEHEDVDIGIWETIKNYGRAVQTGALTGFYAEDYLDVQHGHYDEKSITDMVEAGNRIRNLPVNTQMVKFMNEVRKEKLGFWDTLWKGVTEDPVLLSQIALQSLTMMAAAPIGSLGDLLEGESPDVLAYMAAGAGTGALSYGAIGMGLGGAFGGPGGVLAGGLVGAKKGLLMGSMAGISTALEHGLTFSELLEEEMHADGMTFTKENVSKWLSNPQNAQSIKNRAFKRGMTIGAIDLATGGFAGLVTKTVGKGLVKTALKESAVGARSIKALQGAAGITTEATGGALSEVYGQRAADQEYDAAEIVFEAVANTPHAIVSSFPEIYSAQASEYNITENGVTKSYTKAEFEDKIDGLDDEALALLDIDINNDAATSDRISDRKNTAEIDSQIDARVSNENDRAKLVELEKQKRKAEAQLKAKNTLFSKSATQADVDAIEAEQQALLNKYTAKIDGRTRAGKSAAKRVKHAKEVRLARRRRLMRKIKEGVMESKAYRLFKDKIEVITRTDDDQVLQDFMNQEEDNALFDIGLLEQERANTTDAKEIAKIDAEIAAVEQGALDAKSQASAKEVKGSHGFILEDSATGALKIMINENMSIADGFGNINVAAHEFLHAVLRKTFLTKADSYAITRTRGLGALTGGNLFQYLKKLDPEETSGSFTNRLMAYMSKAPQDRVAHDEVMGQEVLNLLSDAMIKGQFNPKATTLTRISEAITTTLQAVGLKKMKFRTGEDVFRFVKNFNKSVEGDYMAQKVVARAAKEGIEVDFKKPKAEPGKAGTMMSKAERTSIKNTLDDFVQEPDGTKKYNTQDEFRASDDYWGAYGTITDTGLLDGLIAEQAQKEGLTDMPQGFVREVRERIGEKFIREFDPAKNESLFGWMTGPTKAGRTIIQLAAGDVSGKRTEKVPTVPIDIKDTEGKPAKREIAADKDRRMKEFEEKDILKEQLAEAKRKREGKPKKKEGLPTHMEDAKYSTSEINKVNKTAKKADIQLRSRDTGKIVQYKDFKKLLVPSKVGQTSPLLSILETVAKRYGIPVDRIIKKQDLTTDMREAAQTYVKDNVKKLKKNTLPFGETAEGKATGAANTKLGVFYKKGGRVRAGEGRGTQGKPTQKLKDVSDVEYKKEFGINEDNTFINNKKFDGILRAQLVQEAVIVANQAVRQNSNEPKDVLALAGSGRATTMYSLSEAQGVQRFGAIDATLTNIEDKIVLWDRMASFVEENHLSPYSEKNTEQSLKKHYSDRPEIVKQAGVLGKMFHDIINSFAPKILKNPWKITEAIFKTQDMKLRKIKQATGSKIDNAKANNDIDLVEQVQSDITELANTIFNPKNPGDSISRILLLLGHLGTSGKRILNNKEVGKRGQPFANAEHFLKSTLGKIDGIKYKINKQGGLDLNSVTYKDKKVENIDRYNSPQEVEAVLNEIKKYGKKPALKNTRNKNTRVAREVLNTTIEFFSNKLKNNAMSPEVHMMHLSALLSATNGILYRAADVRYISDNAFELAGQAGKATVIKKARKILEEQGKAAGLEKALAKVADFLIYEHLQPRVGVLLNLVNQHMNKDGVENIHEFLKNYEVAIEPRSMDDVKTEAGLAEMLHPDQTYDMPSFMRPFNALTMAKSKGRLRTYLDVKNNMKPLPISEAYAKSEEALTNDVFDNSRLAPAIMTSRSAKNPKKGASFWDLDDTLIRSKSGVRAKIPNPDGTPKPGRKVIFLAGGPGSGKSSVVQKLGLEKLGFKIVNQDISLEWLMKNHGLPKDMRDFTPEQASKFAELGWDARMIMKDKMTKFQGRGDGVVVDGTGSSFASMEARRFEFKRMGYDVHMLFVESSLETSLARNKARKERSLKDSIVERTWKSVMKNKDRFQHSQIFGDNFTLVNTDNLRIDDDIPAGAVDKMNDFITSYENRRLSAEEFAVDGANILADGGTFDFSEFDYVKEGEQGPLFGEAKARIKKYGDKSNYIITARPHASQQHIYDFLQSQGLNIPLENIITLENSTSEAKALAIADKVAEGYNDIYFADDSLENIQAVKNLTDQFDIKSKVQQAKRTMFSKASEGFNNILEESTGISAEKIFSEAIAKKRGAKKGKYAFFIPPSAEDFKGLLYYFLGKGKKGEKHLAWFKEHLLDPLNRGYTELNTAKQSIANDFKNLKKLFPEVKKKLSKQIPGQDFTYGDAIRVSLWDRFGFDIPGLSKKHQKILTETVKNDQKLLPFSDMLAAMSKQKEGYVRPGEFWLTEDIRNDLANATDKVGRKQFFTEFIENSEQIFSKENMNKIEAIYGENFREALEDMLYRINNGTNRNFGNNKMVNNFMNWINGSIGATMFFNNRSATLQGLSTVNFINWGDNNILKAAAAFANQGQFWKDFSTIFNSDMLKQRRTGLKQDVNAAELTTYVSKSKQPMRAAINWLLQKGFLPTQMMDSFAIAMGGATMYRNRIKTYAKKGMSKKDAEAKAWQDFQEIAEETQQSARPDKISMQQASPLGRLILAFQNTPMQYMRLMKKSMSDLVNGRGDNKTNISKIIYYGAVQNLIFYSLQSALFALAFSDDEDDEKFLKKKGRVANGMVDGVLRGLGVGGAVVSTAKNMVIKFIEEEKKEAWRKEEASLIVEMLNLSPPIGIKVRKIISAMKTWNYNKKVRQNMDLLDIDNPTWQAMTNVIEATTNIPLARLLNKTMNVREALNQQNEAWQRIAMFMGWNRWDVGVENREIEQIKEEIKKQDTYQKKKKPPGGKTIKKRKLKRR